jgi:hypothetical protein
MTTPRPPSGNKPRLSPQPPMGSSGSTSRHANDDLAQDLSNLSLDQSKHGHGSRMQQSSSGKLVKKQQTPNSNAGNLVEFPKPSFYSEHDVTSANVAIVPKIAMPIPELPNSPSRTMQHALAVSQPTSRPDRFGQPQSGLYPSPPRPPNFNKPYSDQPPKIKHSRRSSSPLRLPVRDERVHSAPPTPAPLKSEPGEEDDDLNRCHMRTKAAGNPRCTRVKNKKAREPIQVLGRSDVHPLFYCSQHLNMLLKKQGEYVARNLEIYKESNRQNDGFIQFDGENRARFILLRFGTHRRISRLDSQVPFCSDQLRATREDGRES